MDKWFFESPKNEAVITSKQVLKEGKDILLVSHDLEDGFWEFLSGKEQDEKDGMVVSLEYMTKVDPTIVDLHDLNLGEKARRKHKNDQWVRCNK